MKEQPLANPAAVPLELCGLRVRLGRFELGPISFRMLRGDYLVLLGPSGCGKTTLLRAIAGILHPLDGTITMAGREVEGLPAYRRGLGYVPQHSLLFPHLTVAANIRFGLRYARLTTARQKERFATAVESTGVSGLLSRYPATLSGGEARRVALARALAPDPAVLLLDEPLSMLDPEACAALGEMLADLRNQARVTVLHVTHHWSEARPLATLCATMDRGVLTRLGPPEEILNSLEIRPLAGGGS